MSYSPTDAEIAGVVAAAADVTTSSSSGRSTPTMPRSQLVRLLVGDPIATEIGTVVTVSLRTPYDLAGYPEASTHFATYGIHPPTMTPSSTPSSGWRRSGGRLPVAIPGLYPDRPWPDAGHVTATALRPGDEARGGRVIGIDQTASITI